MKFAKKINKMNCGHCRLRMSLRFRGKELPKNLCTGGQPKKSNNFGKDIGAQTIHSSIATKHGRKRKMKNYWMRCSNARKKIGLRLQISSMPNELRSNACSNG